jgi:hypothetical protein
VGHACGAKRSAYEQVGDVVDDVQSLAGGELLFRFLLSHGHRNGGGRGLRGFLVDCGWWVERLGGWNR